jgi:ABC-2 type transport system ATP-binding protein
MDEATLCDRIALMQSGKVLSIDTPEKIIDAYPDKLYAVKSENMYALLKHLNSYEKTILSYAFGEYAHASFEQTTEKEIVNFLASKGVKDVELRETQPTIEDCFIKLLKK